MLQKLSLKFGLITAAISLVATTTQAAPVTWSKDVMPIIQERCLECHRPGQVGPMSLMNYKEARPWAASIKKQVGLGKMPPWPAEKSKSIPFHGDKTLEEWEKDTIINWVDQGAKQGNLSDLPPAKVFKTFEGGWRLGKPDLVLQPSEPFTVKGEISDLYQCFQIPFNVDHEVWLKGVEFQPGNTEVAHHFILFEDRAGTFQKFDDETEEPGCECANMDKIPGLRIIKMWAPGNTAPFSTDGVGEMLTAGKNLVLQAHYYNSTGIDQVDQSRFALHLAQPDETINKKMRLMMVSQNRLTIPAGAPNVRHEAHVKAAKDMTLYSVGVHMHLRGKSIGQWAILPDTTEEIPMIFVPDFDFNWQLNYDFVKPMKAPKGTEFIMRSVHDNSADNPNNPDPSLDVKWGLYSADEMAFSGHYFTYDDEQLGVKPKKLSTDDYKRLDVRADKKSTD